MAGSCENVFPPTCFSTRDQQHENKQLCELKMVGNVVFAQNCTSTIHLHPLE